METTNKHKLPQTIVDAVAYDGHRVAGDLSVTALIDSPRIRVLRNKHRNDLQEDVSEKLWAMFGSAVHNILEKANISNVRKRAFFMVIETLKEKMLQEEDPAKRETMEKVSKYLFNLIPKFFPELESRYIFETTLRVEINGKWLYGTFDLYDKETKRLKDYKVCSVWNYVFPEAKKKWYAQTNVYAWMLEKEGHEVKGIDIVAIFRDWSATQAGINKDYPPQQIMEIDIPMHTMEIRGTYVAKRMELHRQAELGNLPDCTGTERWAKSDEWAVMTPGKVRAIRKFDSEAAAHSFKLENNHNHQDKLYVELRPGESKRCDAYCIVREVCDQRARVVNRNLEAQK